MRKAQGSERAPSWRGGRSDGEAVHCIESGSERSVKFVLVTAVVFLILHRAILGAGREFDPDELQHMHGGFSMAAGLSPYVDYFEHHSPWFPGTSSLLISALGPTWKTLMAARALMWALATATTVATLVLFYRATRGFLSPSRAQITALLAAVLQLTVVTGTDKSVEIRPDVPGTLFFLLGLVQWLDVLRRAPGAPWKRRAILGGVWLGAALMLTPKLAFGAIGIGLGSLAWAAVGVGVSTKKDRLRTLATFVLGSTLPAVATAAWLISQGHFEAFVRDVVVGPLDWARELGPSVHLEIAARRVPLHLVAGLLGFGAMLWRAARHRDSADPSDFVLPAAAAAMLVGWFTIPVPWPQFLLPLWPLVAVAIAAQLARVEGWAHAIAFGAALAIGGGLIVLALGESLGWSYRTLEPALWLAAAAALGGLGWHKTHAKRIALLALAVGLLAVGAYRVQPHVPTYGILWPLLAGTAILAPAARRPAHLLFLAIVAVPLIPLSRILEYRPIAPFRAEFDLIMEQTEPSETVLTGWRGSAVFRPHAYYYFFLHGGMLAMLDDESRGPRVLQALEDQPPGAVIRDDGTRGLSAEVQTYLDEHYEATGVGDVWLRKD